MRARIRHLWERLSSSFWFVPMVMLLFAGGLSWGMLALDRRVSIPEWGKGWLYGGGPDGARTLLSTVANSVITVAGVVFSITIVALTQASSQFGPRLLRNFMRDTPNQLVLGTMVATYLYCLLVLRSIHPENTPDGPVPHLSVTAAVALAVLSIAVLVFFIHHAASSIQAPHVVAAVWRDLAEAIERMYPEGLGTPGAAPAGSEADDAPADHADRSGARPVASAVDGYLQAIDQAGLMEAATAADVQFVMACRPGDFLVRGEPLLWVRPADRCRPELADAVRPLFMFGTSRTTEQDVEFAIDQMAEIAVRALSPGTNDPFTAVTCVDWLGSALARIAAGDLHSPWRHDAGGKLRIVARVTTFPAYCDAAFDQVRHYAKGSLNVHVRLLEAIAKALPHTKTDAQRAALLHHAELIVRQGRDSFPEAHDRCQIEAAYARATAPIMPADAPTG